jgi:hypothetical protein
VLLIQLAVWHLICDCHISSSHVQTLAIAQELTSFIRADVLPRYRILLVHLVLQVLLALRQHLQRAPQAQDGVLGAVLFLCGVAAPEAAETPARHGVG